MENFILFIIALTSFFLGLFTMAFYRFKIVEPRIKFRKDLKVCNYRKCQKSQSKRYKPYCSNSHADLAIGLT